MERLTVLFRGAVQGVGFRYTVLREAGDFDVQGYVKNLRDGRVELVVEAERQECQRFLQHIKAVFARNITDSVENKAFATGEFDGFRIEY